MNNRRCRYNTKTNTVINNKLATYEKHFLDSVDSEYGFGVAKDLTRFKTMPDGFRTAATSAENDAADWIREVMTAIGLTDVQKEDLDADLWEFHGAEVVIRSRNGMQRTMKAGSFPGLHGTQPEGITGEVVYVGSGAATDYEESGVAGKIVLVDTNAYDSHWYGVLFAQAQARGACAVIATVTDRGPGTYCDESITIQNIQGFVDIPAVMLSKADSTFLRELLTGGESVTAMVRADIKTASHRTAHYVHGRIEGKNKDSYVIYSGHYDAYWDGFLDNASSIGTLMTIAKAMIESGYQPENTILFLANGAEEFGRFGTAHDYCIGSTAILQDHPAWIENGRLCANFELSAFTEFDKLVVTVTASYAKWFDEILHRLLPDEDVKIIPSSISGSDHIVFGKAGIPTCMNVSVDFQSHLPRAASSFDHTQDDNADRYDAGTFDTVNKVYGLLGIAVDQAPALLFDFTAYAKEYVESLDAEMLNRLVPDMGTELEQIISDFVKNVHGLRKQFTGINVRLQKAADLDKKLLEINRLFIHDIYKYNASTELIIGHRQPCEYVMVLDELIEGLKRGDSSALIKLEELDYNYLIAEFDKDVYEKTAILAFDESVPQEWVKGHTLPFPDLYDAIHAIYQKREQTTGCFSDEIDALEMISASQLDVLRDVLVYEKTTLLKALSIAETLMLSDDSATQRVVNE